MNRDLFAHKEQLENGSALQEMLDRYQKGDVQISEEALYCALALSSLIVPFETADEKDKHTVLVKIENEYYLPLYCFQEQVSKACLPADLVRMPVSEIVKIKDKSHITSGLIVNLDTDAFVVLKSQYDMLEKTAELLLQTEREPQQEEEIQKQIPLVAEPETKTGNKEQKAEESESIRLKSGALSCFSYALYQNGISLFPGMTIENKTEQILEKLSLKISCSTPFFEPYTAKLSPLPAGKPVAISDLHLQMVPELLESLNESVEARIILEVWNQDERLLRQSENITVLAYDQWAAIDSCKDLLASFVLPNCAEVKNLLLQSAKWLQKRDENPAIEGYQSNDPARVKLIAQAAFAAIQKQNIFYANPPASFSVPGQRIRFPESILAGKLGTCLDMALLYAAVLEAAGLHAFLIMRKGHVLAGVWLRERSPLEMHAAVPIIDDPDIFLRYAASSDLLFIECTQMCQGIEGDFASAIESGRNTVLKKDGCFEYAIDLQAARMQNIRPLAHQEISTPVQSRNTKAEESEKAETEQTALESYVDLGIDTKPEITVQEKSRMEVWKDSLLDLNLQNPLLDITRNENMVPFACTYLGDLENAFSSGAPFVLMEKPAWLEKSMPSDKKQDHSLFYLQDDIFSQISPASDFAGTREKIRQEYRNRRLFTFEEKEELDARLSRMQKTDRMIWQELGTGSLFLVCGLLRWLWKEKEYLAPMLLIPVEILPRPGGQGYLLQRRDEDAHFNRTLLEMLRKNFDIHVFDNDSLPADEKEADVSRIFAKVRSAVFDIKGWDVIQSCLLAGFSFTHSVIWNDLNSAGKQLQNSDLIQILLQQGVPEEKKDPKGIDMYPALPLDDSQKKAVQNALAENSFILLGPPGTGKSQTIAAMMANLAANGKSVLLAAEKNDALSDVYCHFQTMGLENFCLQLHAHKAGRSSVIESLLQTLENTHTQTSENYDALKQKESRLEAGLEGYFDALNRPVIENTSIKDMMEEYLQMEEEIEPLACSSPEKITAESFSSLYALCRKLVWSAAKPGVFEENLSNISFSRDAIDHFGDIRKAAADLLAIINRELPAKPERFALFPFSKKKKETKSEERKAAENRLFQNVKFGEDKEQEAKIKEFCQFVQEYPLLLKNRMQYLQLCQTCNDLGLSALVQEIKEGNSPDAQILEKRMRKGLLAAAISRYADNDPVLSLFSAPVYEGDVHDLQDLRKKLVKAAQKEIKARLQKRLEQGRKDSAIQKQMQILRRAGTLSGAEISLRILFEQIPDLLQLLAPCIIASPDAISRMLSQKNGMFDTLILDEASRIPACRALPAVYRCKNAVVAGDFAQAPPIIKKSRAEQIVFENTESILDEMYAAGLFVHELKWHYRSRHECLFAFSNRKFYQNRLYTFPSPFEKTSHVECRNVQGKMEEGINVQEAKAIVQEVKSRWTLQKSGTIGIACLCGSQKVCIENLLQKEFEQYPLLEKWAQSEEISLAIKSLETMQGEQRDIIFFSTVLSADENGEVQLSATPLAAKEGEKYLNVALSRAKKHLTVFTSLEPEDLKAEEETPLSLQILRDFLLYAKDRESLAPVQTEPCAFAKVIQKEMEKEGLKSTLNLGASKMKIDLAFFDPENPDEYLLAVLIDGGPDAKSHSFSQCEIAEAAMLEDLGWNVCRLYSEELWQNLPNQLVLLKEKIKDLCALRKQSRQERLYQSTWQSRAESVEENSFQTAFRTQNPNRTLQKQNPKPETVVPPKAVFPESVFDGFALFKNAGNHNFMHTRYLQGKTKETSKAENNGRMHSEKKSK